MNRNIFTRQACGGIMYKPDCSDIQCRNMDIIAIRRDDKFNDTSKKSCDIGCAKYHNKTTE